MTRPREDRPHRVCAWLSEEEFARLKAIRQALKLTVHDMMILALYRMERILAEERQHQRP